jgi:hypothetical protein
MRLQIKHGLLAVASICALGATSAPACSLGTKVLHPTTATLALNVKPLINPELLPPHEPIPVGLWQSTFKASDGSTFMGFESIYADGNELLIDNSAPATDNVCSGVWEPAPGPRTYTINHPSWDFDTSGNLISIIVLTSTITIDPKGNTYTGTEMVTVYDPTLTTVIYQGSGTVTATRITPKSKPL